jgi:hypothetical protein
MHTDYCSGNMNEWGQFIDTYLNGGCKHGSLKKWNLRLWAGFFQHRVGTSYRQLW